MSVICTCMSSSSSASVNEIGRVYRNEVEVQGRKAARTTVRLIFFLSFFALLRFVFLPHSFVCYSLSIVSPKSDYSSQHPKKTV